MAMKIVLDGENAERYVITIAHVLHCNECKEHLKVIDEIMKGGRLAR